MHIWPLKGPFEPLGRKDDLPIVCMSDAPKKGL